MKNIIRYTLGLPILISVTVVFLFMGIVAILGSWAACLIGLNKEVDSVKENINETVEYFKMIWEPI